MLSPTSVTEKQPCIRAINDLLHGSASINNSEAMSELTKDTFFENTDYKVVYKNFDYNTPYDSWIYEGNDEDKIVGYKYFQSYPYDEVKFKIGDYIHWNFNHKELSTWLLTSLDTQYLYNVKGRMLQCNNSLRWEDENGERHCYPCVIKDAMTYTNFKWGNKGVVQSGGDIVVLVQRNENTSKINVNDRFLFNEVAFRVKQLFDELNPNYVELYMMKAPELQDDNYKDNVAINENPSDTTENNGIVLLPNVKRITVGETENFTVYNYINKIQQTDTFTINVSNVPKSYYELNIIDGNNFSIKNLKQYKTNPLNLECIDNKTGNKINTIIWLGGNW